MESHAEYFDDSDVADLLGQEGLVLLRTRASIDTCLIGSEGASGRLCGDLTSVLESRPFC